MVFKPFDQMLEKVERERRISDAAHFHALMCYGEMITKFAVAGMVAAVSDGRDRHQYRLEYELVRATGIGTWCDVLDEILGGVSAQHLHDEIKGDGNETYQLTTRTKREEWQFESVSLLYDCLRVADAKAEPAPRRIMGKSWFRIFTQLRNKTRGHGAHGSDHFSKMCPLLAKSLELVVESFFLFQRPWAFLSQTGKGKYRVDRWNIAADCLRDLSTSRGRGYNIPEGVYTVFGDGFTDDSLRQVQLVYYDVDSMSAFLPNGGYNGRRYSLISYSSPTSATRLEEAGRYNTPVTDLPPSETQGQRDTTERSKTTVNLPPTQQGYISRTAAETILYNELVQDNQHRIITLRGRGGIGKTWLTLEVLDKIAQEDHFDAILWFSARDIDLLTDSAKQVKPHILDEDDVADEFFSHIGGFLLSVEEMADADRLSFLQDNLKSSEFGSILFVFDNFETVTSPIEFFNWIDTYLRLPNRALITTRYRQFKGDYPIELEGMSPDECSELIDTTARILYITQLINAKLKDDLYEVSEGHPYIVKILMGEIKKDGRTGRYPEVLARREDMLNTLFERTYNRLSMVAKRVFLTLCSWKSLVAETAIHAVLARPENEIGDISDAIEDLANSSLIVSSIVSGENETYWSVPLAARLFGQRKMNIERFSMAVRADVRFLQFFGATRESDLKRGMQPRLRKLFGNIERQVLKQSESIKKYATIIEYVASIYPEAWLSLADLYKNTGELDDYVDTLQQCIQRSEETAAKRNAWMKLSQHYRDTGNHSGELSAVIQIAQLPNLDYKSISDSVNRFNFLVKQPDIAFDEGEKIETVSLLIDIMAGRDEEADADDCSRLAWLYLQLNQVEEAEAATRRGLGLDPRNYHCLNILEGITS